jgi:hypothetical protein
MTKMKNENVRVQGWLAVSVPIVISACGALMTYGAMKAKTQENDQSLRDLSGDVTRLHEGGARLDVSSQTQAAQIGELKAMSAEQHRLNLSIEGRLGRIEGKIDRIAEREAR